MSDYFKQSSAATTDNNYFTTLCQNYIKANRLLNISEECLIDYNGFAGFSFISFKTTKGNRRTVKFQISNKLYGIDRNNNYFRIKEHSQKVLYKDEDVKTFYVDTQEIGNHLLFVL